MIPVLLTKLECKDGVVLEGIYCKPYKKSKTALIWIHGYGSNFFYGQDLMSELIPQLRKNSVGYFKFNTRGRDLVVGFEQPYGGGAFEKFEECILDVDAMVDAARKLGYTKIILAGHSNGCNKIVYYLYKTLNKNIKGVILLGPISDRVAGKKNWGPAMLNKGISIAKQLVSKNELMPTDYGVITASRFLSQYAGFEDVFDYDNLSFDWKEFKSITIPIAVIFGSKDELINHQPSEIIKIFESKSNSVNFTGVVVKRALHGFQNKEKEVSNLISTWIKDLKI